MLANPKSGYYTSGKQVVFGAEGDFITSPEICQVFGEVRCCRSSSLWLPINVAFLNHPQLVGVWCVALWQQQGCPSTIRVVELGPGRGSLMADLLRSTTVFSGFRDAIEVHMVEVSGALRRVQHSSLCCGDAPGDDEQVEEGRSQLNGAQVC